MMPYERAIPLDSGTIHVRVDRDSWPLDALCDFAARDNPRRGFLIVSKVLGRHIPVAPSVMRRSYRDLAALVSADLPQPILVVGLAETAICLGQGVHEELVGQGRRALYLHSTRQRLDHPELCRFEEPHSHASRHILYRPVEGDLTAIRSVLLVDDEVSTGTTLRNLADALMAALPQVERIAVATLADWSGTSAWREAMPRPAQIASLLSGKLDWRPNGNPAPVTPRFQAAAEALGTLDASYNWGRLGRTGIADEGDNAANGFLLPLRLRIVGTGEFTYPPFRLAERLEATGHDVVVQSTTRSPAPLDGAIRRALTFADNYATAVPNFLYNADPADGRFTLVCHETPAGSIDPALLTALDAKPLPFAGGVGLVEAPPLAAGALA